MLYDSIICNCCSTRTCCCFLSLNDCSFTTSIHVGSAAFLLCSDLLLFTSCGQYYDEMPFDSTVNFTYRISLPRVVTCEWNGRELRITNPLCITVPSFVLIGLTVAEIMILCICIRPIVEMGQEALCFRIVFTSLLAYICAWMDDWVKAFSNWLAVDFSFIVKMMVIHYF